MAAISEIINTVTVVSLLITAAYALSSVVIAFSLARKLPKSEKYVIAWLIFNGTIHFTLELPFVIISLIGTVQNSESFFALLWKEYGKADYRWLVSNPIIVSLETLTAFICGPLCAVVIYATLQKKFYRHFLQIVLCVCELYGGWMTFCPEWLTGSLNLTTDNFMYMWVYLFFFNGLWVVFPLILLYQSWFSMKVCFLKNEKSSSLSSKKD